ncbi:suppressor of fused domain protein [Spirillospora sp. NPDC047279]|uniref:suppressor of fused domain protein n=1 Tax=Spirillospora sp. NPDC047279 TaxID=3155478 RepID=UPI0033EA04EC
MGLFGRGGNVEQDDDERADGWDAITAALDGLYPDVKPRHVGYTPGVHFGSGLQGCSAYEAAGHWHYVTYGLTELWDKESDDPQISGYGFEFTMRVVRAAGDPEPPTWPFNVLEQVAKFVRSQGAVLGDGHRMDTRNSITGDPACGLTVLAFTLDPQLPPLATPNGRVEFLQLVGVTAGELARMKETSTAEVLAELASGNPLLVTDPARG